VEEVKGFVRIMLAFLRSL